MSQSKAEEKHEAEYAEVAAVDPKEARPPKPEGEPKKRGRKPMTDEEKAAAKAARDANPKAKAEKPKKEPKPKAEKLPRKTRLIAHDEVLIPAARLELSAKLFYVPPADGKAYRRPDTFGARSLALLEEKGSMTVGDYQKAGGRLKDLRWDIERGRVLLEGFEERAATVMSEREERQAQKDSEKAAEKAAKEAKAEKAKGGKKKATPATDPAQDKLPLEATSAESVSEGAPEEEADESPSDAEDEEAGDDGDEAE